MGKAGLTLGQSSEAALGLYWRYFASDAPSCCCTWKPRGAALSVLNELGCSSVPAEIMLRVTLVNVCFFPVCSLNLSIVLLFHLTTGWARHFVSDWRHGQIGQRKKAWFETFPPMKIWIFSLLKCWFSCNSGKRFSEDCEILSDSIKTSQ